MEIKNVLSLFNGMSCGRIALNRAGIEINKYYSSEVDKYAMMVADANYPQDVPCKLGDVRFITPIDRIDLLIGGSPCQNFSFAGNQKGLSTKDNIEILTLEHYLQLKSDGFEFVGQSYLFWEYVRILKDIQSKNPDVLFLLENVMMVQKWKDLISETLGVQPIMINSSLVSAQNRKRLYWTNIPLVEQPEDKDIFLKDILLNSVGVFDNMFPGLRKAREYFNKSCTIRNNCGQLEIFDLSSLDHTAAALDYMNRQLKDGRTHWDYGYINCENKDKSSCITANIHKGVPYNVLVDSKPSYGEKKINPITFRKLHPVECERLQTVPDNYTNYVSKTQRYKMLGNGWTVDVIAHIFSAIDTEEV